LGQEKVKNPISANSATWSELNLDRGGVDLYYSPIDVSSSLPIVSTRGVTQGRTTQERTMRSAAIIAVGFCALLECRARADDRNAKSAEREVAIGFSCLGAGKPAAAQAAFDEAIRLDPTNYRAYFGRGVTHATSEKWAEAVAEFDKAIRLKPDEADLYFNRGLVRQRTGEANHAIEDANRALKLNPKHAPSLYLRAEVLSAKGQYKKAVEDYDTVAPLLAPKEMPLLLNARGNALSLAGDSERAMRDFNEALRLDPKCIVALINRSSLLYAGGKVEKALQDLSDVLRIDPASTDALCNRGMIWKGQNQKEKAVTDFSRAIEIDPRNIRALYCRALKDYSALLHLDPNMADARLLDVRLMRAIILRLKAEWKESLVDFDTLLKQNPKHERALVERALLRACCPDEKFFDAKRAVEDATEACRLSNWKNAEFLHILGVASAAAGDFKKALEWERKALEHPDYSKLEGDAAKYHIQEYEANRRIIFPALMQK
jgi:tetratricopeptide (TPR) repeat protein